MLGLSIWPVAKLADHDGGSNCIGGALALRPRGISFPNGSGLSYNILYYLSFHLALAAFLAISLRRFAVIPSARALPPIRPSATAAAFLPSSVVMSSISPVAILAIMMALPMASAGRFSPFGPVGILLQPSVLGGKHTTRANLMQNYRPAEAVLTFMLGVAVVALPSAFLASGSTAPSHGDPGEFWGIFGRALKITDTLLVLFTLGLFVATALLWRATLRIVQSAERTAQLELRAYIAIDGGHIRIAKGALEIAETRIRFKNVGKTPALNTSNMVWTRIRENDPREPGETPVADTSSKAVMGAGTELHVTSRFDVRNVTSTVNLLESGTMTFYHLGVIQYEDIFGQKHVFRFLTKSTGNRRRLVVDGEECEGWHLQIADQTEVQISN